MTSSLLHATLLQIRTKTLPGRRNRGSDGQHKACDTGWKHAFRGKLPPPRSPSPERGNECGPPRRHVWPTSEASTAALVGQTPTAPRARCCQGRRTAPSSLSPAGGRRLTSQALPAPAAGRRRRQTAQKVIGQGTSKRKCLWDGLPPPPYHRRTAPAGPAEHAEPHRRGTEAGPRQRTGRVGVSTPTLPTAMYRTDRLLLPVAAY